MGSLISIAVWVIIFWLICTKTGKKKVSKDGNKSGKGRGEELLKNYQTVKQEIQKEAAVAFRNAAIELHRKTEADRGEEDSGRQDMYRSAQPAEIRRKKSMDMVKSAAVLRKTAGLDSLEDDEHDWLARQLKEERESYRAVSEMFEVKMSHLKNCEAENLRLEHSLKCAAARLAEESRRRRR